MEDNDLQRELDLAELRRRDAEADRQEQEAGMVQLRYWLEVMKWILLKFRDSLTEMDSRFRGNDVISARHVTFTLAVAVWPSFPRKRESIA